MAENDGGRAFPRASGPSGGANGGMSLRDWFAGMAMQHPYTQTEDADRDSEKAADWAYDVADAMLAEKRRREKSDG